MKIIDFAKKGNIVRFYLGEKTEDWGWTNPEYKDYTGETPSWLKPKDTYYGDDWDSEDTITANELGEAIANRETYLATMKQRQDEYKASQGGNTAAPSNSGFNF